MSRNTTKAPIALPRFAGSTLFKASTPRAGKTSAQPSPVTNAPASATIEGWNTEALDSFGKAAAAAQAEVFARKLRRSMVGGSPKIVVRENFRMVERLIY
jgi:hypothetical protein